MSTVLVLVRIYSYMFNCDTGPFAVALVRIFKQHCSGPDLKLGRITMWSTYEKQILSAEAWSVAKMQNYPLLTNTLELATSWSLFFQRIFSID